MLSESNPTQSHQVKDRQLEEQQSRDMFSDQSDAIESHPYQQHVQDVEVEAAEHLGQQGSPYESGASLQPPQEQVQGHQVVQHQVIEDEENKQKTRSCDDYSDENESVSEDEYSDDSESGNKELFLRERFRIFLFTQQLATRIQKRIQSCGGTIANDANLKADYLAVPDRIRDIPNHVEGHIQLKYSWLRECCRTNSFIRMEYFHHPLLLEEGISSLNGLTIVVSQYIDNISQYI